MANALTDAAKNRILDSAAGTPAWPPSHLSLHSGDPGSTGANEISGGSPAYARKAVTWDAAASGLKAIAAAVTFDVPGGTTVYYVGMWSADAAGTFFGYSPAGSGARKAFTVDDLTADTCESPAHGFSDGDQVVVWATIGAGLPTGISEGTAYYVVNATTDDFQLSTTSGGAAVNFTAVGDGDIQKITPEAFTGQGTYQVSSFSVSLPG